MRTTDRSCIRAARSLYGRWHSLGAADRERLAPLAAAVKHHALELPGRDEPGAWDELSRAGGKLAEALASTAEADPGTSPGDARALRDDLRRDLERLAGADIAASRVGHTRPDAAHHSQAG
jgi:hypothetical protein